MSASVNCDCDDDALHSNKCEEGQQLSKLLPIQEGEKESCLDGDFREAQNEWNLIKTIPIIDLSNHHQDPISLTLVSEAISIVDNFNLVDAYFQSVDLTYQLTHIKPRKNYSFIKSFWRSLPMLGSCDLRKDLINDRNKVFAIALLPFNYEDTNHVQFLATIYTKLTNKFINPNNFHGNHWEKIGFQGTDPATDLRGVGMLAIYQLLYLLLTSHQRLLGESIYRLSLDSIQNFPFAAMSTNITQITMQVLRSSKLNNIMNRTSDVFRVINEFYCDLFYRLFIKWKNEGKTINDAGYVLKGL